MRKRALVVICIGVPISIFALVGCPPSFVDFCSGTAECGLTEAGPGQIDAGTDAGPSCDLDAAFVSVDAVPGITDLEWVGKGGARLSPDEKTIYFDGAQDAGTLSGLVTAKWDSVKSRFGETRALTSPASSVDEFDPVVSTDQMTLVFSRSAPGSDSRNFFISTRTDAMAPFTGERVMTALNSPVFDGTPFLTSDAGELWFTSDRDAGRHQIFRAFAADNWFADAAVIPVPSLTAPPTLDLSPVLSSDGKTLFFATDASGDKAFRDIWEAHRDLTDQDFKAARPVAELNLPDATEYPSWLSPDGCRLYMTRNGPSGAKRNIYVAERPAKK